MRERSSTGNLTVRFGAMKLCVQNALLLSRRSNFRAERTQMIYRLSSSEMCMILAMRALSKVIFDSSSHRTSTMVSANSIARLLFTAAAAHAFVQALDPQFLLQRTNLPTQLAPRPQQPHQLL